MKAKNITSRLEFALFEPEEPTLRSTNTEPDLIGTLKQMQLKNWFHHFYVLFTVFLAALTL